MDNHRRRPSIIMLARECIIMYCIYKNSIVTIDEMNAVSVILNQVDLQI